MLAPRKKLWSTPKSVIDVSSTLLNLKCTDKVYDIGAGDGRVLIHLAKTTACMDFVGIEIDHDRAEEARRNVLAENLSSQIEIKETNALYDNFDDATVVFLYLVPRGLSLIHPLLMRLVQKKRELQRNCHPQVILRVITYISKLKGEQHKAVVKCSVAHHNSAAWPVYLYHFS